MSRTDLGTGFLSRVLRRANGWTSRWLVGGPSPFDLGSAPSPVILSGPIQRQQHDDGVRRREFDDLRQIRQQAQALAGVHTGDDTTSRASFQASRPSRIEDRASTLRKINDIEAQMSRLWDAARKQFSNSGAPLSEDIAWSDAHDRGSSKAVHAPASARVLSGGGKLSPPRLPGGTAGGLSSFGGPDLAFHPVVKDAAVLFANGDDARAEAVLLGGVEASAADEPEVWLALCDFYRARERYRPFERCAAEVARRFGRLAPAWALPPDAGVGLPPSAAWSASPALDAAAVTGLQHLRLAASAPCTLDWSALQRLDAKAARALLGLFSLWAEQDVRLEIQGGDVLRQQLKARTPVAGRGTEQLWWELRMAALRLMHLRDEFEQVAHDFGLTYGIPAPPWEAPLCATTVLPPIAEPPGLGRLAGRTVLRGEIVGAWAIEPVAEWLRRMPPPRVSSEPWVLSCRDWVRVDFAAARALLNAVTVFHARGHRVRLVEAHRLVAAFFEGVGLTAWAPVALRKD